MSKKCKEEYHFKQQYFNILKETSKEINFYVKQYIQKNFNLLPKIRKIMINEFSLGKSQLRPSQLKFVYKLAGGKNVKEIIPLCAAFALKERHYYYFDDYFDLNIKPKGIIMTGIPFQLISWGILSKLNKNYSSKQIKDIIKEFYMLDELNLQGFLIEQELGLKKKELYLKKVYGYNFWEQIFRVGVIMANSSTQKINLLGEIGKNMGMSIIISNDTWDFGKDLEDFRLGIYTLPITHALENSKGEDNKILKSFFGKNKMSEKEKDKIRKIVVRIGSIKYGKNEAQKYRNIALKLLKKFPDSEERKMIEFASTMTEKNKYFKKLEEYE